MQFIPDVHTSSVTVQWNWCLFAYMAVCENVATLSQTTTGESKCQFKKMLKSATLCVHILFFYFRHTRDGGLHSSSAMQSRKRFFLTRHRFKVTEYAGNFDYFILFSLFQNLYSFSYRAASNLLSCFCPIRCFPMHSQCVPEAFNALRHFLEYYGKLACIISTSIA